jgi:hypothetical protein
MARKFKAPDSTKDFAHSKLFGDVRQAVKVIVQGVEI